MSEQFAPGAGDPGRQPTEEEVRAYLAQLRQTDVTEIVAQAFSMLASGAEVKLGRRDARMLIDAAAAVADQSRGKLDSRLIEQMDQAVSQLRVAQVDAEKQLAQLRDEGKLPADEEGDLPVSGEKRVADAPTEPTPSGGEPPQPPSQQSAASRLWVPGR